ncbi:hypothetical protein [Hymenobacter sp.]|uniref:hypothetical protein n=1 Tax=Hymenobacter sp. TaxID=1898978 RepID=UPI00286D1112|nr:hypothetical protein [Hymenobacter sp.]
MSRLLAFLLLLGTASALASCQQVPQAASVRPGPAEIVQPAPGAQTAAQARDAVARFLQTQPNAALFVLDSARVNDNETSWQVLVPRTDWARRMPNRARFEVDKATGAVRPAPVK